MEVVAARQDTWTGSMAMAGDRQTDGQEVWPWQALTDTWTGSMAMAGHGQTHRQTH